MGESMSGTRQAFVLTTGSALFAAVVLFVASGCKTEEKRTAAALPSFAEECSVPQTAITMIVMSDKPLVWDKAAEKLVSWHWKELAGRELSSQPFTAVDNKVKGAIFLGAAAVAAGGITVEEMEKVGLDGFRLRVAGGNVYSAVTKTLNDLDLAPPETFDGKWP